MKGVHQRTRRDVLRLAASAAGASWIPRRVWGGSTRPASDKLGVAVIGVAGQGLWNIQQLLKTDAAIVALCDVDERRSGEARTLCPKARFFVDFREMLDKAGRDFDAVLVATPDHTHAVATIAALQAGKHVYCEKPLTHSVWETRQVMAAARKHNRVTQMGIQVHAGRNYRRVVELIRVGTIGRVREVHAWCPTVWSGRSMGFQPMTRPSAFQPVEHGQDARATWPPPSPIPPGLNWDLWLGPAPERPYADKAYVPAAWRGWWDFGGGGCADMGCHFLDLAYWTLDLGHPTTIEAHGPPVDAESAPEWLTVRYEYPLVTSGQGHQDSGGSHLAATESGRYKITNGPGLTLTWTVGRKGPPAEFKEKVPDWKEGVLFVGDEGMLVADFNRLKLLPIAKFAGIAVPARSALNVIAHHREFIDACKSNGTTSCPFDYAGVLTQAVLLGNVAYRAGRRIEWDAERMTLPNAPEAERYLRRPYRNGWDLPSL